MLNIPRVMLSTVTGKSIYLIYFSHIECVSSIPCKTTDERIHGDESDPQGMDEDLPLCRYKIHK